jgi:hypothetical protein
VQSKVSAYVECLICANAPSKNSFSMPLKVHKNENFSGYDFEFCTISLLVMHK